MKKAPLEIGDYRNELMSITNAIQIFQENPNWWYKKTELKEGEYPLSKIKPLRHFNQRYTKKEFVEIGKYCLGRINKAEDLIYKINNQVKTKTSLNEIKKSIDELLKIV